MTRQTGLPLVSIVTLNFNGKKFLAGFFESLQKCSYPNFEIIFVDNCSQDDSVDFVKKHFPDVKIVQNDQNYLFAKGNNEGLKIVKGKYVCVINNDVEVDPGFIEPIIAAFEKNGQLAAIQPKILAMQQRDFLEYSGACGGFIDWLGFPFVRGRIFRTIEKDEGQYDQPTGLFWASGACIFLRKSALDAVGVFDEDFELHMEEIDLCWRLRLHGWDIAAIPQSRIWHFVGGTLNQDSPWKMYWNYRNNLFLLIKNLSFFNLLIRMPLRIPLDLLALFVETVKGRFENAAAIIRGYVWVMTHLRIVLHKRRIIQKSRKISDAGVLNRMYRGSIVLEYFLLGKKRFSDLLFVDALCKRSVVNTEKSENSIQTSGVTLTNE